MTKAADEWLYVYVSKNGNSDESFLGLYNEEESVNFIPAFKTKDDANDCFLSMPREKGKKYEVQAVHVDDLEKQAKENNFVVTIVDKDGNIVK